MSKPVRLSSAHKPMILDHLINLSLSDRYLRFCSALSDSALSTYVDQLEMKTRDAVYGIIDIDHKQIIGVLHVASVEGDTAEFALSVDSDRRKQGIGDMLFERGLLHCESIGVNRVYMQCLASNQAIKRMASKRGMAVTTDYGESIARLNVSSPSDVAEWLNAVKTDTIALYDLNCKFTRHQWDSYVDELSAALPTPPPDPTFRTVGRYGVVIGISDGDSPYALVECGDGDQLMVKLEKFLHSPVPEEGSHVRAICTPGPLHRVISAHVLTQPTLD